MRHRSLFVSAVHQTGHLINKVLVATEFCDFKMAVTKWQLNLIGSSRNDYGDGYENVKLYRAYSDSINSSNVGKFFFELNSKGLHQS